MTLANPMPASGKIQGHHRDRQAVVYVAVFTQPLDYAEHHIIEVMQSPRLCGV